MADLLWLLLPAVLFLPITFFLLREVISPSPTNDGRRLPRGVPLLMLLVLLSMYIAWFHVLLSQF